MAASRPVRPRHDALDRVPPRLVHELLEAVRAGARTPAEAVGLGPAELGAVEQVALGHYRGGRHAEAALLYGFVLRLDSGRPGAWRGLGACAQATRGLEAAAECYRRALDADPRDTISKVLLGEVLCLRGLEDPGLRLLAEVAAAGVTDAVEAPYVARARAIAHAHGGRPPHLVVTRPGETTRAAAILADPALRPAFDLVREAVASGRLTLAQVGGFTPRELDGAYAVACRHLELGRVLEAMQIAGFLMFLDPLDPRHPRLVGICLQRIEQHGLADYLYGLALALDGADPTALVYRGETRLLTGDVEAGLELVRQGIAAAGTAAEHRAVVDRGRALLERFGRKQPATTDGARVCTPVGPDGGES